MAEDRLWRIENQLDGMAESLKALIRVEERTTSLLEHNKTMREDLSVLRERVTELEKKAIGQSNFFRWIDKIGLTLATGVVVYFFTKAGLIGD